MSFTSMKQFMEENHFTVDMLTEDEKVYVEIFDALIKTDSRESYLQAKEKYKEQFPTFSKVNCEVYNYFNGPETSAFVKALVKEKKPLITDNLSKYDGELYFDHMHDNIKHKYIENAFVWNTEMRNKTIDDMKAMPYTPNVDLQQLKDLDRFLDEAYQITETLFSKADEKYHNGKVLHNADASSIYSVLHCAMGKGDKALYKETYDAVMNLEAKFHEIKDWEKLQFPLLNLTPSRTESCPIEFKDNYFFSSIIMQAPVYHAFKLGSGLSLSDVAKNPNYITADTVKTVFGHNLEKAFKEDLGTPAHDKEVFDFLTTANNTNIFTLQGGTAPMIASNFGLSMVIHLDKNIDSPEAMLKGAASDSTVSNLLEKITEDLRKIPVSKRLEALVKVENPMENWQAAYGLIKAPAAKGEQIGKSAQTLVNLVQESKATVNEKKGMMMGIERGLNASYKENTWFLQRWIGWGNAKQYKAAIGGVRETRMALSSPTIGENNSNKPDVAKKQVDLGIGSNKKQLSPDPVRQEAPTVTKDIDVNVH